MSTENVGSDINPYDDGEAGRQNYLNLHSDQSLLLIWKFRTKPKKQGAFLRYAKSNWEQYHEENVNNEVPSKTVSSTDNEKENRTDPNQGLITHSYKWDKVFQDASRPLVVDVGWECLCWDFLRLPNNSLPAKNRLACCWVKTGPGRIATLSASIWVP